MTKDEIKEKLYNSGSGNESDCHFPVVESGLYIVQELEEYSQYVNWFVENGLSFDLTLAIGIGSGGEVKFFRDIILCKRTITIDCGAGSGVPYQTKHWDRIKETIKSEIVEDLRIRSESLETKKILEKYKGQIEYAFVDGGHDEDIVMNDVHLVEEFGKDECLIGLHDTKILSGPSQVALYLSSKYEKCLVLGICYGLMIFRVKKINV